MIDYENHAYIRGVCAHVERKDVNTRENTLYLYNVFIRTQKEYKGQVTSRYTRIKFIRNVVTEDLENLKDKPIYVTYDVYSKQLQGKDGQNFWVDEVVGRTYEIKEQPNQQVLTPSFEQSTQPMQGATVPTQHNVSMTQANAATDDIPF